MQTIDFEWYVDNMGALFQKYGDCYLAIKNKSVLGRYQSYAVAVKETLKTEPIGTFIVQRCGTDESVYTNYISSFNFVR